MTHPIEKTFCTTREAANLLGVSVGTVQLWVENGLLQAWKTRGGHRRVLRDSVNRLLHSSGPGARRSPGPALPAEGGHPHPSLARRLRVLVLEENRSCLEQCLSTLTDWPMAPEVMAVDSAIEALICMGRQVPDLLLMNLRLTGVDGLALVRALRASPQLPGLELVVITDLDEQQIEARGGLPPEVTRMSRPVSFERLHEQAWRISHDKGLLPPAPEPRVELIA